MKLGEVLKHRKGFITIDDDKDYKLCRVQVNRKGVVQRAIVKGSEIKTKKQQVCKAGDFLVAEMDAKFGGYGFVPKDLDGAIVSSHYFLFELDKKKIRPKYLEAVSKLLILQDQIKATGSTNYSAVRPSQVLSWEIPYVDISSQMEIEKLFETTSEKGSSLKIELAHQQDLLKQLSQSFLIEAVQGKLVSQYKNEGNATDLLNKIKTEKERLIAEKKIKVKKLQEPEMQQELLFEIPSNWIWCKLDDLTYNITDGTHQTPAYTKKGKPFLSAQHIKPFKFSPDNNKFVSEEAYLECIKNKKPEKGDILITRVGAIGEAAIIDQDIEFAFYVSVGLIQPFKSFVCSEYLELVINSPYGNSYSKGNVSSKGSSAGNLNLGRIRSFQIPLPPLLEQKRIVKKLGEVMNLCEELKTIITNNQTYTDKLLQVALKNALQPKMLEEFKIISPPAFEPVEETHFLKRKILATYIINQSITDNRFGDVKFEKLLYLADYFAIKRNLGQKYYQKAAGPYDNTFTHAYFVQIEKAKWFNRKKSGNQYIFSAGLNHNKSINTYNYFSRDELQRVNEIISYFKNYNYEQPEIVSTLFAVWNNRIIRNDAISYKLLINDFYEWDEKKTKYERSRLVKALEWMKSKNIVPDGWGQLIEKVKKK